MFIILIKSDTSNYFKRKYFKSKIFNILNIFINEY